MKKNYYSIYSKYKTVTIFIITIVLFCNQKVISANSDIVLKTSFEENQKSLKTIKMELHAGAKTTTKTAAMGNKSIDLSENSLKAAVCFKGLKINWKQGAIGFSFKLRTTDPRIFCNIQAQLTNQPEKIGFTISKDKKYFILGVGNKANQKAYFRCVDIIKKDVWHRALFSWQVNKDNSALITCYIDGKRIGEKGLIIQKFIPENYTEANPAKIALGQYLSFNSKYGFNGYLDAFIIYNFNKVIPQGEKSK